MATQVREQEQGSLPEHLRGLRLHVVTGKGGTGKTTTAAALALALAAGPGSGGRPARVLLAEVEGRGGAAALFDREVGYEPVEVAQVAPADGRPGGHVLATSVDAEESLLEYLELLYRIRRTSLSARGLRRAGAIDFATSVAPGMADVLLTGKLKEAVDRTDGAAPAWDAVVCDAPPTGRIAQFLDVNTEVAGLARMGPIRGQADSVMRVLRSPRTAVHVVTVLESLPVQETADAVAELASHDLPRGALVVNLVSPPLLPRWALREAAAGGPDPARVRPALEAAGVPDAAAVTDDLVAQGGQHASRLLLEESLREELTSLGLPLVELPRLAGGVDAAGLRRLAAGLRAQGVL